MARHQKGHIYESSGAFYIRFYKSYANLTLKEKEEFDQRHVGSTAPTQRVQLSHRLAVKDDKYYSAKAKAVKDEGAAFMVGINKQEGSSNQSVESKDMRIVDFWDKVYWPFIQENKRPRTAVGYKKIWESTLRKHFAETTLKQYGPGQGTNFVTALSKKYAKHTVQHVRALASAIFSHAIATAVLGEGVLAINPWRNVVSLVEAKDAKQTPHYTVEEIEQIIFALNNCAAKHEITKNNGCGHSHPDAALRVALCFYIGLRPSETTGLDWSDFTGDGYVSIRRAVVDGILGETKTDESTARLQLIEPVLSLLRVWHQQCGSPRSGWVFPSEHKDKPANISNLVNRVIKPALKQRNIAWKSLYAGRRGGATLLVDLTNGLVAAQELLRHKTMTTTANFYKKQTQNALPSGMKLMEAAGIKAKGLLPIATTDEGAPNA